MKVRGITADFYKILCCAGKREDEHMSIRFVLFDLDGTLLPMDQDEFTRGYFKLLAEKMAPHGYEHTKFIDAVWSGVAAMVANDGSKSNEEAFWGKFAEIYGKKAITDKPIFEEFYANEFEGAKNFCQYNSKAVKSVHKIKEMGYVTVLATNPLFPSTATEKRIRWGGFKPDDFELYTTYENSSYCKPNPDYYREILKRLGAKPEECLMVGNDVEEDMVAENIGMKVFLLTDCLINKEKRDISAFPNGSFEQLTEYVVKLRER